MKIREVYLCPEVFFHPSVQKVESQYCIWMIPSYGGRVVAGLWGAGL